MMSGILHDCRRRIENLFTNEGNCVEVNTELIKLVTALIGLFTTVVGLIVAVLTARQNKVEHASHAVQDGPRSIAPQAVSLESSGSQDLDRPGWPRPVQYLVLACLMLFTIGWDMTLEYLLALPVQCIGKDCAHVVIAAMRATDHRFVPGPDQFLLPLMLFFSLGVLMLLNDTRYFISHVWKRRRKRPVV